VYTSKINLIVFNTEKRKVSKMKKKNKEDKVFEELSIPELKTEDLLLLDQTDKPFLILYLFIFVFGIILTVVSI